MKEKIRLLVVDDYPVVRAGVRALLNAQMDMVVVAEAKNGVAAKELAALHKPDVVIMDITMSGADGLTATREIVHLLPQTKVLVLTMHKDEEYLRRAIESGASGYVLKEAVDTELAVAIRTVMRGDMYVFPSFTRVLLGKPDEAHAEAGQYDSYDALSAREREVLRMVALGYTNRQTADRLGLSTKTVETYRARCMEKLNLASRAALVRYALERGLLDEE
jgi:two-component system response regulator NreC